MLPQLPAASPSHPHLSHDEASRKRRPYHILRQVVQAAAFLPLLTTSYAGRGGVVHVEKGESGSGYDSCRGRRAMFVFA